MNTAEVRRLIESIAHGVPAHADELPGLDQALSDGDHHGPCLMLVNGFGDTPSIELYLMKDNLRTVLQAQGFAVVRSLVARLATSLVMAGCSATDTVLDDELVRLWDEPLRTAAPP